MTKGPGSRAAGIAMAYKLIDAAQARWRAVNGPASGRPGPRRRDLPQMANSSNDPDETTTKEAAA